MATTKTKSTHKITLVYNGFHGRKTLAFVVPTENANLLRHEVSKTVATRLNNACCGCSGCRCGEGPAESVNGERWYIELPEWFENGMEIKGRYPQA